MRREDHEKEMYRIKCEKSEIERKYIEVKERVTDIIHDKKNLELQVFKLERIAELLKEEVIILRKRIEIEEKY